ncbi:MAG: hypothetical protein N3G76_00815 [Candidatus Micrarchaeota archaeon]|nr:hypothetical protein [Candidatus Micrarchaeota archaeon]
MGFINALGITLAVELSVLYVLLKGRLAALHIIKWGCAASLITLPFVWFAFPFLSIGPVWPEIFAFVVEAVLYYFVFPAIGWRCAFGISLLANAASFAVGLMISSLVPGII